MVLNPHSSESAEEAAVSFQHKKIIGGGIITLLVVGLVIALSGATPKPIAAARSAGAGAGMRLNVEAPTVQSAAAPNANDQLTAAVASDAAGAPIVAVHSGDIASADLLLTDKDNGQTIRVAVGQTIGIKLKENRTTGFGWAIESKSDPTTHGPKAVSKHLELLTDKSLKSTASMGGRRLIGAPGEHVFMFRAKSVGSDVIYLTYRRPWLPASTTDPAQTYEVNVQITEEKTT